jgi:hypothetical protein
MRPEFGRSNSEGYQSARFRSCGDYQTMVEHDLYHAGEINHLRALFTRDDRWAYL